MTEAEKTGMKMVAASMSAKDLKWQIANAKKCRLPAGAVQVFKDELAKRGAAND